MKFFILKTMSSKVVEDSVSCQNLQKNLKSAHGWPHNRDFSEDGVLVYFRNFSNSQFIYYLLSQRGESYIIRESK